METKCIIEKFKFSKGIAANVAKPAKVPVNKGFEPANVLLRFAKVADESPAPAKTLANISNTLARENTCKINNFSDFSNISKGDSIKIEKMTVCLDGKPCNYLYVKDRRQMCRRNNQPIFDMDACPLNRWAGTTTKAISMPDSETFWCTDCEHGQRKTIEDMPILWCQVSDKAVIDLGRCPAGHWVKDAEGRPHDTHIE